MSVQRLFLKTSRIFRKTGNRHGFFRLPGRKRAANLTISSTRRVFLEPAGYKSNGRNVSPAQRRLPCPNRCYRNVEHILSRNQCRSLQPFNAFKPFCESYKWAKIDTTEQMALTSIDKFNIKQGFCIEIFAIDKSYASSKKQPRKNSLYYTLFKNVKITDKNISVNVLVKCTLNSVNMLNV